MTMKYYINNLQLKSKVDFNNFFIFKVLNNYFKINKKLYIFYDINKLYTILRKKIWQQQQQSF